MTLNYNIDIDYSNFNEEQLKEAADRLEITLRLMPPSFYLGLTDNKDTVLRAIMQVMADEFGEIANLYKQIINESRIDTAYYYLDEWLKLYQLPLDFPRQSVAYRRINRVNDVTRYYYDEKAKEINRDQLILWRDVYNNSRSVSWNYLRAVEDVFKFYGYDVRVEFESPYANVNSVNTRLHYLTTINGVRVDVYNTELFNRVSAYYSHEINSDVNYGVRRYYDQFNSRTEYVDATLLEDERLAIETIVSRIFGAHVNVSVNITDLVHSDWRLRHKRNWEGNIFNVYGKGDLTSVTELYIDEINHTGVDSDRRVINTQGARLIVKGTYYPDESRSDYVEINIDEYVNIGPDSTIPLPVPIDISDMSLLTANYYSNPNALVYKELTESNLPDAFSDYLFVKISKDAIFDNYGYSEGRGEIIDDHGYLPVEFFTDVAIPKEYRKVELLENFNYLTNVALYGYNTETKVLDKDLGLMLDDKNTSPVSMWSNGTTMWVLDDADSKIFAYDLVNLVRDEDKDPSITIDGILRGLGSDGRDLMWVLTDDGATAHTLSSMLVRRDKLLEFDVNKSRPSALYFDPNKNQIYVAHAGTNSVDVYDKSTNYIRTIDLFRGTYNVDGRGAVYNLDNTLLYVVDYSELKVFVYNVSDHERNLSKEFNLVSGNSQPSGITIVRIDSKNYVYIADQSLHIYVYDINGTDVNFVNTISLLEFDIVSISSLTSDGSASSDSTTLWAMDDNTKHIYAYSLPNHIRLSLKDIDTSKLSQMGSDSPIGISYVDDKMYVVDSVDTYVYVYDLNSSAADAASNFDLDATNVNPRDITVNDNRLLVLDANDHKLYAYKMLDKSRESSEDFVYLEELGNLNSTSIMLQGGYLLALDNDNIYVYDLSTPNNKRERLLEYIYNSDGDTVLDNSVSIVKHNDKTYVANSDTKFIYVYSDRFINLTLSTTGIINLVSDNNRPYSIWSNGTTMWVLDNGLTKKLYAYNLSGGANVSSSEFNLDSANASPEGIWGNSTTMWVADKVDRKLYAYNISSNGTFGARVSTSDIILTSVNVFAQGIWSDGETMWVADPVSNVIFAYDSDGTYNADLSILELAADNLTATGIWSDGDIMWVADRERNKYFAYDLESGAHNANKDIDHIDIHTGYMWSTGTTSDSTCYVPKPDSEILAYSFISAPASRDTDSDFTFDSGIVPSSIRSIWTDGNHMWILDIVSRRILAYDLETTDHVSYHDIALARDNSSPSGMWGDVANGLIWVSDSVDNKLYAYLISENPTVPDLTMAESNTEPRGLAVTNNGYTIWIADRKESKIFAYDGELSYIGLESLTNINKADIRDIWSDGTTLWAINNASGRLYAYDLDGGDRSESFDLISHRTSARIGGIAADSGVMWVVSQEDTALYAYSISTKQRASSNDFTSLNSGNTNPAYIYTDGTTMWVLDTGTTKKFYAYKMADKTRDSGKEFDLDSDNANPTGIYSNGTTMWVADSADDRIYAYTISSGSRNSRRDRRFLPDSGNTNPAGVWSDGTTMWVADSTSEKIYAYITASYNSALDFTTLAAADNITPYDIWSDEVTMWVSDPFDTKLYAYNFSDKQHDSSKDFNNLDNHGNSDPTGIWSDETTMWISDGLGSKIYAYKMSDKSRDSDKDFDTLSAAGNTAPRGIWSDETTMWVADGTAGKIYAYSMSDKARDSDKDFDTLSDASNTAPGGIWSDGETMWVVDHVDDKIYAYRMSDTSYDPGKDLNVITDASISTPTGIWEDGTTMWIADYDESILYAYTMAKRDIDEEFDTLTEAGNNDPEDLWSNGTTMWVSDSVSNRIYAYNLADKTRDPDKDIESIESTNANYNPVGVWSDGNAFMILDANDISGFKYIHQYDASNGNRRFDGTVDIILNSVNDDPKGIWSDGTTVWVSDDTTHELHAYTTGGVYDVSKRIPLVSDNASPRAIWGDGSTIWVVDAGNTKKLYAYDILTRSHRPSQDILLDPLNNKPYGIWSDGKIIWISDISGGNVDSLFAYTLTMRTRAVDISESISYVNNSTKYINLDSSNKDPVDMWSDDTYIWVSDNAASRLFAYDLSSVAISGERTDEEVSQDYNLPSFNNPGGISGSTLDNIMWITNYSEDRGLMFKPIADKSLINGRAWDRYYCKISLTDESENLLDDQSVLFNMGGVNSEIVQYNTVMDYEIDYAVMPLSWREMYNRGDVYLKLEFYASELMPIDHRDVNTDININASSLGIIVIPYYYNKEYNYRLDSNDNYINYGSAVLREGPLTRITNILISGSTNIYI